MHFYKVAPFEFLFVLETEVHASYAHLRANGNQATQIRIEDLIIIFESITNTAAEIEEASLRFGNRITKPNCGCDEKVGILNDVSGEFAADVRVSGIVDLFGIVRTPRASSALFAPSVSSKLARTKNSSLSLGPWRVARKFIPNPVASELPLLPVKSTAAW